ncbi:uncharacterized [Tachysurus ichikawai]
MAKIIIDIQTSQRYGDHLPVPILSLPQPCFHSETDRVSRLAVPLLQSMMIRRWSWTRASSLALCVSGKRMSPPILALTLQFKLPSSDWTVDSKSSSAEHPCCHDNLRICPPSKHRGLKNV